MFWFDVGCIGLFTLNLRCWTTFSKSTSEEAFEANFLVNAVMHGLWGIHNLHQIYRLYISRSDNNTVNQLRRPWPLLFYSTAGACGSAMVRNIYAIIVFPNVESGVVIFTWIWEWLSLGIILTDFFYFLIKELKWGANVLKKSDITTTVDSDSDGGDGNSNKNEAQVVRQTSSIP